MQFRLPEEQALLRDTFARMFAAESTSARIRAAAPLGFDAQLWELLVKMGAVTMRVGTAPFSPLSLFEAGLVLEQAGRHLAPVPLVETVVAARLLGMTADTGCERSRSYLDRISSGDAVVVYSPRECDNTDLVLVPGGAIADAVLCSDGRQLLLCESNGNLATRPENLGDSPLGRWDLSSSSVSATPIGGSDALRFAQASLVEWRVLTASFLVGLGRRALELAGEYTGQREQFGRPIGSFQGVAHPLADAATAVEGAALLFLRTIAALSTDDERASAFVPMSLWSAATSASTAVATSLHMFGGYGLTLEYDIQLYHSRAKAAVLIDGDPADLLLATADAQWPQPGTRPPERTVCDAGAMPLDFDVPESALALAAEGRSFFRSTITPELAARAHHSWEGHDVGVQRALAKAGLLFPDWPVEHGGRGCTAYETISLARVFHEAGWTRHAISVTDMVGRTLMAFGSERIKTEILPRIAAGDAICSFGFTEPEAGSDVFAAKTRATRTDEGWRIDGQKMFTSGADIAQYVLLLTRSDPAASKHRGLTLFLVPLDAEGVAVQAVHTISDERTNITFYSDVLVDDSLRVGPVDGGARVLGSALAMEHADSGYPNQQLRLVQNGVAWARSAVRRGIPRIDDPDVRRRLARASVNAEIADLFGKRSLWAAVEDSGERWIGPMSKLFSTETYISDATDLLDLAAPESLLRSGTAGSFQLDYRIATATSIYGGSSEIMRSVIAETFLSLPRTRT